MISNIFIGAYWLWVDGEGMGRDHEGSFCKNQKGNGGLEGNTSVGAK